MNSLTRDALQAGPVDLEERKLLITRIYEMGAINHSTYLDMLQEIRNEEQVGVLEYMVTDDGMSKYWS